MYDASLGTVTIGTVGIKRFNTSAKTSANTGAGKVRPATVF